MSFFDHLQGNCPSNDCSSCPCGTGTSYTDIGSACRRFSGWSQSCCECIARHESGGNLHAANQNRGGSYDVGLWQINNQNWASWYVSFVLAPFIRLPLSFFSQRTSFFPLHSSGGRAPCDLESNLQCAIKVWGWGGNSFRLWSTCGACGCC